MMESPTRYTNRFTVVVPSSDWRTDPDTEIGHHYLFGNGIVHHDVVNIPFYGRMYDTATIAHPLSPSDHLDEPRTKITHIQFLMNQLRDIQRRARGDRKTTFKEVRARQDSIELLGMMRRKAIERQKREYLARESQKATLTPAAARCCGGDSSVRNSDKQLSSLRKHQWITANAKACDRLDQWSP